MQGVSAVLLRAKTLGDAWQTGSSSGLGAVTVAAGLVQVLVEWQFVSARIGTCAGVQMTTLPLKFTEWSTMEGIATLWLSLSMRTMTPSFPVFR